MQYLTIKGKASGKVFTYSIHPEDLDLTLLSFCQKYQIPMASSCNGDNVCKKCVFNGDSLGCQKKIKEIMDTQVFIDYL